MRGVAFDIDDTLSTHGKLRPEAYTALWRLREAGFILVAVTGRPAGWCDQIARFWPVHAVIGENGAFSFFMDQEGVRRRLNTPGAHADAKSRLRDLGSLIQNKFPGVRWASDQAYREYDLAIDFCEDVKPAWSQKKISDLVELCRQEGAHAKVSSIHVNTWYGEFDKCAGFSNWLLDQGAPGVDSKVARTSLKRENWIFIGDSPNDEPLFEWFRDLSVGVANLRNFAGALKMPPRWLTKSESGAGFIEMTDRLIRARKK